jgi:hypothetical protein
MREKRLASKRRRETIVFEGGLGSQLLPLLHALNLHSQRIEFDVKLDYFTSDLSASNMVIRPWRLDRYGFTIDEISKIGLKNSRRKFGSLKSNVLSDFDFGRKFGSQLLPVNVSDVSAFLLEKAINPSTPYSVVHLRRGDYLKVSSRVISDLEMSEIIFKLKSFLHKTVIVISDSKIGLKQNSKFKNFMKTTDAKFVFVEGLKYDEVVLHDVMRNASLLICSNSTFSFSAAILGRQEMVSFAPIDFFDPKTMETVNQTFRSAGNFFLLD